MQEICWANVLLGIPIGCALTVMLAWPISKIAEYFANGCVWINWRKLRRQHEREGKTHG